MKTRTMVFSLIVLLIITVFGFATADIMPPKEVNQIDNCVILGTYEQWYCYEEGLEYIDNGQEPIEWIVLEKDGTNLLLVSKYPLDYQQYNTQRGTYSWKSSSICCHGR